MQLSCHSVAIVLKLIQTKQITIDTHKRDNKTIVQTEPNRLQTSTNITKQPHITKTPYKAQRLLYHN